MDEDEEEEPYDHELEELELVAKRNTTGNDMQHSRIRPSNPMARELDKAHKKSKLGVNKSSSAARKRRSSAIQNSSPQQATQ